MSKFKKQTVMRSVIISVLFLFSVVFSACNKEVSRTVRIRFENQTQWNFTNIQVKATSKYAALGNLAIGETSDYMVCDTFYRNRDMAEPWSFSANISPTERMAVVQPTGPVNTSYAMLEPGAYTVVINSGYYTGSPTFYILFRIK